MRTAIRSDDPVLVFEDSNLWGARGDVPTDPDFMIPFGQAEVRREGTDVTIIGIANATRFVTQAAGDLEKKGISAEVIDPRTLVPFDWETIFASVEKTRRLVVVDPAPLTCSFASEISATVSERLHDSLHVPVVRVTGPDCHVAFSPPLERAVLPTRQKVVEVVERVVNKIPAQA
jgi:pyruvate dehydrogenase E1 component beta subunit